jgi:uncharacterized phage-associated protein
MEPALKAPLCGVVIAAFSTVLWLLKTRREDQGYGGTGAQETEGSLHRKRGERMQESPETGEDRQPRAPALPFPNSAAAVANWLIFRNREDPSGLTHLKIQMLLYLCQGWHLVYFDTPLFEDNIHAWKLGPVVISVCNELRASGDEVIRYPVPGYGIKDGEYMAGIPHMVLTDEKEAYFMESLWKQLAKLDQRRLVSVNIAKDGPWSQIVKKVKASGYRLDPVIPIGMMKTYFKSLHANGEPNA